MDSRLSAWKSKLLSQVGQATLVKSVVNSLPLYTVSSYRIPDYVCKMLDAKARNFLWTGDGEKGKLPCISWTKVCRPKDEGGLGIRTFREMNQALVAKLGCQLAVEEDRLRVKLIKSKYFPFTDFLHCNPTVSGTWLWCGILDSRQSILRGACYCAGKGNSVRIWDDPWILYNADFKA